MPFTALAIGAVVALLLLHRLRRILYPLLTLPLPPGPKGLPIIGNLLDVPTMSPWKTFHEWSKLYGIFSKVLSDPSCLKEHL